MRYLKILVSLMLLGGLGQNSYPVAVPGESGKPNSAQMCVEGFWASGNGAMAGAADRSICLTVQPNSANPDGDDDLAVAGWEGVREYLASLEADENLDATAWNPVEEAIGRLPRWCRGWGGFEEDDCNGCCSPEEMLPSDPCACMPDCEGCVPDCCSPSCEPSLVSDPPGDAGYCDPGLYSQTGSPGGGGSSGAPGGFSPGGYSPSLPSGGGGGGGGGYGPHDDGSTDDGGDDGGDDDDPTPPAVVPEPGSLILWGVLASLGVGFGYRQRRERRRTCATDM